MGSDKQRDQQIKKAIGLLRLLLELPDNKQYKDIISAAESNYQSRLMKQNRFTIRPSVSGGQKNKVVRKLASHGILKLEYVDDKLMYFTNKTLLKKMPQLIDRLLNHLKLEYNKEDEKIKVALSLMLAINNKCANDIISLMPDNKEILYADLLYSYIKLNDAGKDSLTKIKVSRAIKSLKRHNLVSHLEKDEFDMRTYYLKIEADRLSKVIEFINQVADLKRS